MWRCRSGEAAHMVMKCIHKQRIGAALLLPAHSVCTLVAVDSSRYDTAGPVSATKLRHRLQLALHHPASDIFPTTAPRLLVLPMHLSPVRVPRPLALKWDIPQLNLGRYLFIMQERRKRLTCYDTLLMLPICLSHLSTRCPSCQNALATIINAQGRLVLIY